MSLEHHQSPFIVRQYRPADKLAVRKISAAIYGGNDWISSSLAAFSTSPTCFPYVALQNNTIVYFCIFRQLHSFNPRNKVFTLEAGRVIRQSRNKGIATRSLAMATTALMQRHGTDCSYRFLTSVDIYNKPSIRHISKLNWTVHCQTRVWPHFDDSPLVSAESPRTAPCSLLNSLGLSQYIRPFAFEAVPLWTSIQCAQQIITTLAELQSLGGTGLMHRLYRCDTAADAGQFLDSEFCTQEGRSVWKLSRHNKPPILLFYRARSIDAVDQEPDHMYSACVVDAEGAECCVAFADSVATGSNQTFRMAFDGGLPEGEIERSAFLSRLKWEIHVVFEQIFGARM